MKLVKNSLGREVPTKVNGQVATPFKGIGKHKPKGNCLLSARERQGIVG